MSRQEITGIGFGIYGHEDSYIVLIDEKGEEQIVSAHRLLPEEHRTPWALYEALTGGFGPEHSAHVLERESNGNDAPRACRMKIIVETQELSAAETEALIAKAKARKAGP